MITEVYNLRKAGLLNDALISALEAYKANDCRVNKLSLAWVYYDYCKRAVNERLIHGFLYTVGRLKELLVAEDVVISDRLLWQYVKFFSVLQKEQSKAYEEIDLLFESLKGIYFTMPSKGFSALIAQLHKCYIETDKYLETMGEVIPFLGEEDFRPKMYRDIYIYPLAEQIYLRYCQKLSEIGDKEIMEMFAPILSRWLIAHPEYRSLLYYQSKIRDYIGS